ncbi:hypothetical protein [Virgibacillus kimchii]
MDQTLIDELIDCLKKINQEDPEIYIPQQGFYDFLELKSKKFLW